MGRVAASVDPRAQRRQEAAAAAESPRRVPATLPTSSGSPAASQLGPGASGTTSSSRQTARGTSPGAPRPPGTSRPFSGREDSPGISAASRCSPSPCSAQDLQLSQRYAEDQRTTREQTKGNPIFWSKTSKLQRDNPRFKRFERVIASP